MTKITFIGAGSTVFMKNIVGDALHRPALSGATIALMDIDAKRLEESALVARKMVASLGASAKIETYTSQRAALDGAGITSVGVDLVAPYLTRGELVRVLSPWITGRLAMYAALPSRKFIPHRTRVFLDFLLQETRQQASQALAACSSCGN